MVGYSEVARNGIQGDEDARDRRRKPRFLEPDLNAAARRRTLRVR
jgi:hypothetical protein